MNWLLSHLKHVAIMVDKRLLCCYPCPWRCGHDQGGEFMVIGFQELQNLQHPVSTYIYQKFARTSTSQAD